MAHRPLETSFWPKKISYTNGFGPQSRSRAAKRRLDRQGVLHGSTKRNASAEEIPRANHITISQGHAQGSHISLSQTNLRCHKTRCHKIDSQGKRGSQQPCTSVPIHTTSVSRTPPLMQVVSKVWGTTSLPAGSQPNNIAHAHSDLGKTGVMAVLLGDLLASPAREPALRPWGGEQPGNCFRHETCMEGRSGVGVLHCGRRARLQEIGRVNIEVFAKVFHSFWEGYQMLTWGRLFIPDPLTPGNQLPPDAAGTCFPYSGVP